jgi:hypothetical protein
MLRSLALVATLLTLSAPALAGPSAGGRLLGAAKGRAGQQRQNVRDIRAMQSSVEARYGGLLFGRPSALTPDRALVRSVAAGTKALQRLGHARPDRFAYVELIAGLPVSSQEASRALVLDIYGNFQIETVTKLRGGGTKTTLSFPMAFDLAGVAPAALRGSLQRIDTALASYDGTGPLPDGVVLRTR